MKKLVFLAIAVMIMMAGCSKSDTGPDKKNNDPPPLPPLKKIVLKLILDVKTQNPYAFYAAVNIQGCNFTLGGNFGDISIVPSELIENLYGQTGVAIPDLHVQIGDAIKDGLVTPDTVRFIAKDTVELRYTLEDPPK